MGRPDDIFVQRLAVVVSHVEGNGASQLRHPDILTDILVQVGEEDLALAGLEAVYERGMERSQSAAAK